MSDISFLPQDMRAEEEKMKQTPPPPAASPKPTDDLKMHVPNAEADEDIEIIEVDEGDLAAVLSDEPLMTRLTYQASLFLDKIKGQLFKKEEPALPAKVPPQFFRPPKPGLVTKARITPSGPVTTPLSPSGMPSAGARPPVPSRARITPQADTPRRVRIIRRIRKPVRVSLISAEELAELRVDTGRRKWTLGIFIMLFSAILITGYIFLSKQLAHAKENLNAVETQVSDIRTRAGERTVIWKKYEDLEARLRLLNNALNEHIVINRLFDVLQEITLPTVSYRSANFGKDGTLSLDVIADSYDSASGQMIVLESHPKVLSAEASSFTLNKDEATGSILSVTFQLQIKLNIGMFKGPALVPDVSSQALNASPS